jgi:hypothetical protein
MYHVAIFSQREDEDFSRAHALKSFESYQDAIDAYGATVSALQTTGLALVRLRADELSVPDMRSYRVANDAGLFGVDLTPCTADDGDYCYCNTSGNARA